MQFGCRLRAARSGNRHLPTADYGGYVTFQQTITRRLITPGGSHVAAEIAARLEPKPCSESHCHRQMAPLPESIVTLLQGQAGPLRDTASPARERTEAPEDGEILRPTAIPRACGHRAICRQTGFAQPSHGDVIWPVCRNRAQTYFYANEGRRGSTSLSKGTGRQFSRTLRRQTIAPAVYQAQLAWLSMTSPHLN